MFVRQSLPRPGMLLSRSGQLYPGIYHLDASGGLKDEFSPGAVHPAEWASAIVQAPSAV